MSLAEYYQTCAIPKGKPRELEQREKRRARGLKERKCRKKVDLRDGHRCFVPGCYRRASDKHHIKPRSLGGQWIPSNILSSCRTHHNWFKAGFIRVRGNPNRGHVRVVVTALGREAGIRLPRAA